MFKCQVSCYLGVVVKVGVYDPVANWQISKLLILNDLEMCWFTSRQSTIPGEFSGLHPPEQPWSSW